MPDPLILHSAVTMLSYRVAQDHYGGEHYVWCAPCRDVDRFASINPPSSDPVSIYRRLVSDIRGGDKHSSIIRQNRRGIRRGATVKEQAGVIDAAKRKEIEKLARTASLAEFQPILLVMPFEVVRHIIKPATLPSRAAVWSQEFIIERLPRSCFDVLELEER